MEDTNNKDKKKENSGLLITVEGKTYIDCCCCKLKVGLIFPYIYITASTLLNVINRIIFYNYGFRFNFTFSFLQQIISLILFTFAGTKSKTFIKEAGKISFRDFYQYKYHYLSFALVFLLNILNNFYGSQLVENVSMFLALKKLNAIVLFLIDFFLGRKSFTCNTVFCIFLLTIGSVLVGMDSFSKDRLGYIVVFFNMMMSILYSKYSEEFKRATGVSSLKLLVYNSYITNPVLIISIFVSGEYKRVYDFILHGQDKMEGTFLGLSFYLFMSCSSVFILTSSFFISNEKNTTLITNLLTSAKSIIISTLLHFFDKKKNDLSFKILAGLVLSTIGAISITSETFLANLLVTKDKKKKNNKDNKDNGDKGKELIDINDNEKGTTQDNKQ